MNTIEAMEFSATIAVASFIVAVIALKKDNILAIMSFAVFFIFIVILYSLYGIHNSNIKVHKQHLIIKREISKILTAKTKDKKAMAYIYGETLKGSYGEDKKIIQCYNEFHNFKETAECLKGFKNNIN